MALKSVENIKVYSPPWPITSSGNIAATLQSALRISGVHGGFGVVREWVNEFRRAPDWAKLLIIESEPARVDERWDALLAGVCEYLAFGESLRVPRWALSPSRFLEYGWWVTNLEGLRAVVMRDTPPALLARNVFLDGTALESV
jgi:hypothetical protein